MQTVLLVIHIFICLGLVGIILIQRTASDGLGLGGGSNNSLLSGRSSANLLTRTTAILAALFMLNSLVLAYLASHAGEPASIIDRITKEQSASPKPAKPVTNEAPAVPLAK